MTCILIEATQPQPLLGERLTAFLQKSASCLQAFKIRRRSMYISLDGHRTLCIMEATDADTVRQACYQAGSSFDLIWSADIVHEDVTVEAVIGSTAVATDQPVVRVLATVSQPSLVPVAQQLNAIAHLRRAVLSSHRLSTFIARDGHRAIIEFDEVDAKSVQAVFQKQKMNFETIWSVRVLDFAMPVVE
ncbi:MAG: hypothetical protein ACTS2F_27100 [Thainema sp.]